MLSVPILFLVQFATANVANKTEQPCVQALSGKSLRGLVTKALFSPTPQPAIGNVNTAGELLEPSGNQEIIDLWNKLPWRPKTKPPFPSFNALIQVLMSHNYGQVPNIFYEKFQAARPFSVYNFYRRESKNYLTRDGWGNEVLSQFGDVKVEKSDGKNYVFIREDLLSNRYTRADLEAMNSSLELDQQGRFLNSREQVHGRVHFLIDGKLHTRTVYTANGTSAFFLPLSDDPITEATRGVEEFTKQAIAEYTPSNSYYPWRLVKDYVSNIPGLVSCLFGGFLNGTIQIGQKILGFDTRTALLRALINGVAELSREGIEIVLVETFHTQPMPGIQFTYPSGETELVRPFLSPPDLSFLGEVAVQLRENNFGNIPIAISDLNGTSYDQLTKHTLVLYKPELVVQQQ